MTIQMVVTLAIVIGMIVMILSDKFAFGAPPLIACTLLVITGCSTISEAFSGFTDKNIVLIAGFMVVMAALQKTSLFPKVESIIYNIADKGGKKNFVLLLLVIMIGSSIMGSAAYYAMVLSLAYTIPYNKNLPISKIFMPLGFASCNPIIPIKMAGRAAVAASLLESAGIVGIEVPVLAVAIVKGISSFFFLIWVLIIYRFLPDHPIADTTESGEAKKGEAALALPKWKEYCVYGAFIVTVICMCFLSKLGEAGYMVSGLMSAFLFVIGVLNFKEIRENIASPLIIMMASIIGVAGALANSGLTTMIGDAVANALGSNFTPFFVVLIFAVLTSVCATFTGSSLGSVFIFAPIGISACISMGLNPIALAISCVNAGWINYFMPIDGMPAMVMGMGKYKLTEFWKFTIPLYIIDILATCTVSMLLFPV